MSTDFSKIKQSIEAVPTSELKYYLAYLLDLIHRERQSANQNRIKQLDNLANKLEAFSIAAQKVDGTDLSATDTQAFHECLAELVSTTETIRNRLISETVYTITGIAVALIVSVPFAILAAIYGAFTGMTNPKMQLENKTPVIKNIIGMFHGMGSAFLVGLCVGLMAGYRTPARIMKTDFEYELDECFKELLNIAKSKFQQEVAFINSEHSHETVKLNILSMYYDVCPKKILSGFKKPKKQLTQIESHWQSQIEAFFRNQDHELVLPRNLKLEEAQILQNAYQSLQTAYSQGDIIYYKDNSTFQAQLKNKAIRMQPATTSAFFSIKALKGYIGQHTFIRYNFIKDPDATPTKTTNEQGHWTNDDYNRSFNPIELDSTKKTTVTFVDQAEKARIISGDKFYEMLRLDLSLRKDHPGGFDYFINKYQSGAKDCRTYVNKALIGTNQEPTSVKRFTDNNANLTLGKKVTRGLIMGTARLKELGTYPGLFNPKGQKPLAYDVHLHRDQDKRTCKPAQSHQ